MVLKNTLRKKILVADDDPAISEALVLILDEYGYDVDTVLDGQAIYKMKDKFPDLLLLDVWMSGQDGRDICRFLKNKKETQNIPIIMFSASRDIKDSTTEAGANDFLSKPFEMEELIDKIERQLN